MKEKLVKLISDDLNLVFETGQTFFYFKKNIIPHLMKLGIFQDVFSAEEYSKNLELLYNTYGSFYYSTKSYSFMLENKNSRPYWQYYEISDLCASEICKVLNNKIFLFDSPFWDKFTPPNHPNCYATIKALDQQEVENKNLQLSDKLDFIHPFPEWGFNPLKADWKKFFNDFILKTFNL